MRPRLRVLGLAVAVYATLPVPWIAIGMLGVASLLLRPWERVESVAWGLVGLPVVGLAKLMHVTASWMVDGCERRRERLERLVEDLIEEEAQDGTH